MSTTFPFVLPHHEGYDLIVMRGTALQLRFRDDYLQQCLRCGAKPGEPCTYVSRVFRRDPQTGVYAYGEPGQPMILTHSQRRARVMRRKANSNDN
jgi:hypothetical protein